MMNLAVAEAVYIGPALSPPLWYDAIYIHLISKTFLRAWCFKNPPIVHVAQQIVLFIQAV